MCEHCIAAIGTLVKIFIRMFCGFLLKQNLINGACLQSL